MLLVMRHGHSLSNAYNESTKAYYGSYPYNDPVLTYRGLVEAKEGGEFLRAFNIARVITSPMKRCLETTAVALDALGYTGTVTLDPMLRERHIDEPAETGTKNSELRKVFNDKSTPNAMPFPNQKLDLSLMDEEIWFDQKFEAFEDFMQRRREVAERYLIAAGHSDSDVTLIVTHAGIAKAFLPFGAPDLNNAEIVQAAENRNDSKSLFKSPYDRIMWPELKDAPQPRFSCDDPAVALAPSV